MVGKVLGRYQIESELGAGGMGEVFKAEDLELKRKVAIKALPHSFAADEERMARFKVEARAVAALNHPNIVTIYSVECVDGVHFLVMELVEGATLKDVILEDGFDSSQFFKVAIPMADALSAAHAKGIAHRDLKPSNVMITSEGTPKVIDFGLAKLLESDEKPTHQEGSSQKMTHTTQSGLLIGTLPYMSPEQIKGIALDERSDLFSLGAILFEMATGQTPFHGETNPELISSILRDPPNPNATFNKSLPDQIHHLVHRCLQKDIEKRIQSAREINEALKTIQAQSSRRTSVSESYQTQPGSSSSGLAAILFTDMVGYSSLMHRNEKQAMGFLDEQIRIIQAACDEHQGRILKKIGDGALMCFSSAVAAVKCAVQIQKNIAERNAALPEDKRFQLRAGIHLGDVVHQENDLFGDDVNIAARVESQCPHGGVCLTRQVHDIVSHRVNETFLSMGTRQLKGIQKPFELFQVDFPWIGDADRKIQTSTPQEIPRALFPLKWVAGVALVFVLSWLIYQELNPEENSEDFANNAKPVSETHEDVDQGAVTQSAESDPGTVNPDSTWSSPLPLITSGDFRAERDVCWAPDNQSFAFAAEVESEVDGEISSFTKIFISSLNAKEPPQQITFRNFNDRFPVWNKDQSEIYFVREVMGKPMERTDAIYGFFSDTAHIMKVNLTTLKESLVINGAENAAHNVRISPNGKKLAYDSLSSRSALIYVAEINGANPKAVSRASSESEQHVEPTWSPDSNFIAYRKLPGSKIFVLDLQTHEEKRVTMGTSYDMNPVWSPDGHFIYYTSYIASGMTLWRMPVKPDGSPRGMPQPVTRGSGHDFHPMISPDGTRLSFHRILMNSEIYALDVDPITGQPKANANPSPLISSPAEDSRGVYNPDETRVAFNSDRNGNMTIWIHDVTSGREWPVTSISEQTGLGGDYQPSWSPDGKSITFFSYRSHRGDADIFLIQLDDKGQPLTPDPIRLTTNESMDTNPFYSPNGDWIAFQSDRNQQYNLFVVRPDGSDLMMISDQRSGGHFTPWFKDSVLFSSSDSMGQRGFFVADPETQSAKMLLAKSISSPSVGGHSSVNPTHTALMECENHQVLWVLPLDGEPRKILSAPSHVRTDYPVWSPSGNKVIFDWLIYSYGGVYYSELKHTER